MKKSIYFSVVILLGILFPISANAQLSKPDIIGTWTGLQQEDKHFKRVTLAIENISDAQSNQTNSQARNSQQVYPGSGIQILTGRPLSGSLKFQLLASGRLRGLPEAESTPVSGEFLPSLNMIKLKYKTRRGRLIVYGVLNSDKTRMALVYGINTRSNILPIYLTSGFDLPDEFSSLVETDKEARRTQLEAELSFSNRRTMGLQALELRTQLKEARRAGDQKAVDELTEKIRKISEEMTKQIKAQSKTAQQRSKKIREQQQQIQANAAGIREKISALQQQAAQALQKGDIDKAQQLNQEAKALNRQYVMALQGKPVKPLSASNNSNACSEKLLTWADELEKNGASASSFNGMVQLTNLFRPSVFNRYFEDDLFSMDPARRRGIAYELHRNCTKLNNDFARGGNILSVVNAFGDEGFEINYISASIAGETLDIVHEWFDYTITEIAARSSLQELEALKMQGKFLLEAFWPNETNASYNKIKNASSEAVSKNIIAQINTLAAKAETGGLDSITELGYLSYRTNSSYLTPSAKTEVEQYFNNKASKVLSGYFKATFPAAANDTAEPRQALMAGKKWYEKNGALFTLFFKTDIAKQFKNTFLAQREILYKKISPELESGIGALNQKAEVQRYASNLSLPIDNQGSKTWQAIKALKAKRIIELDREAYIARVGEGPLKPDDPGAIYLNALYRKDWKTIEEEDRAFREPLMRAIQPLFHNGLFKMMSFASGGIVKAESLSQKVNINMRKTTMSTTLAGFYILALNHIAKECLGPNPVKITRTVSWDEVLVNGYGMEISRMPHSETYHYIIANRHEPVFRRIGEPANVEIIDFISSILSGLGLIPEEARVAIDTLVANLRGLRKAMQDYDCNSEVIKTLEDALIYKSNGA